MWVWLWLQGKPHVDDDKYVVSFFLSLLCKNIDRNCPQALWRLDVLSHKLANLAVKAKEKNRR